MNVSIATSRTAAVRASRQTSAAAQRVSDEDVLQTVLALSRHHYAPSTSLIILQLTRDGAARRGLDSTVAHALQRLLSRGLIASVTHRGTRHWAPVAD
jgi:hypothetical protein